MQNKSITKVILLRNGKWTKKAMEIDSCGWSLKDSEIEPLIKSIQDNDQEFFKEHQVTLANASYEAKDEYYGVLWKLHFKAKDICLSDIDPYFLKPMALAWDMNYMDAKFETITIDHSKPIELEDPSIPDNLYISIRAYF